MSQTLKNLRQLYRDWMKGEIDANTLMKKLREALR